MNWKVLSDNIGSCNLHVVHGALKSATEATMWNLKSHYERIV